MSPAAAREIAAKLVIAADTAEELQKLRDEAPQWWRQIIPPEKK